MIANNFRTSIYGKEISKFKDEDEDYPIQLRLDDKYRYAISSIKEQKIVFRDNKGTLHNIPASSVIDFEYSTNYASIKRRDLDRVVTLSGNVLEGYNSNKIVQLIKDELKDFNISQNCSFEFTGEQEEQTESIEFLSRAIIIAMALIFLILVSQFNSISKPFIIVISVILSMIGLLLGISFFQEQFVVIMTGVGIISLAGIVVNNAIVLVDYTELMIKRKKLSLNLDSNSYLEGRYLVECLVNASYARLRPVLLTAITTILGLIPLAMGLNIDFRNLYLNFEPNLYVGGLNEDLWGPMAWTIVYGLTISTFLILLIVPAMYFILLKVRYIFHKKNMKSIDNNLI